jgi:hypothetical protein
MLPIERARLACCGGGNMAARFTHRYEWEQCVLVAYQRLGWCKASRRFQLIHRVARERLRIQPIPRSNSRECRRARKCCMSVTVVRLDIQNLLIWKYPCAEEARCRSQWPRGLRHELSSSARTLGSWVRIPLEVWMSVCVYSVFVLSCVGSGLATGWSPVQRTLPCIGLRNWKSVQGPTKGCKSHTEREESRWTARPTWMR